MSRILTPAEYDRDELDEKIAAVYDAKPEGDAAVKDAGKDLLDFIIDEPLTSDVLEDGIEWVASETPMSRSAVRSYVKDQKGALNMVNVERVVRHIYPEKTEIEFWVVSGDETANFKLDVSQLDSHHAFREEIIRSMGVVIKRGGWDERLSQMLSDSEVVRHDYENYLGKMVLDRIEQIPSTSSQLMFKTDYPDFIYAGEDEVWVPRPVVQEVADEAEDNLTPQATRRKLDHMMLDGRGKQFSGPDGETAMAWRFKPYVAGGESDPQ